MSLMHESFPSSAKVPLQFRADGLFRVLMMTDAHRKPDRDQTTIRFMESLIERTQPDLVLLGGDNICGCATREQFMEQLSLLVSPMERAGIPFAHVFGNHDRTPVLSKRWQQERYESFPHCVSRRGPAELPGVGNHFLPVTDASGNLLFGIWTLDSHQDFSVPEEDIPYPDRADWHLFLPERLHSRGNDDFIRLEQIRWYEETSRNLELRCHRKIPSLMVFHIPIFEFHALVRNASRTGFVGEYNESICCSEVNSGLFAAVLQREDVRGIFCGHDHNNTFDGSYCGIRLGYAGSIGIQAYGLGSEDPLRDRDRLRGGRVLDILLEDPWQIRTRMVFVRDGGEPVPRPLP